MNRAQPADARQGLEPVLEVKEPHIQGKEENGRDGQPEYQALVKRGRAGFFVVLRPEPLQEPLEGNFAVKGEEEPENKEEGDRKKPGCFGSAPGIADIV